MINSSIPVNRGPKKQAGVSLLKTRVLTEGEISVLESRGNSSDDWSQIYVKEPFDPYLIKGCEFRGYIRIGRLEKAVLNDGRRNYYCGLKNSVIISSDIGDYCCIENNDFISHVIIGNYAVISGNREIYTSENAKFGNSIAREGESEDSIPSIEVINERGGRGVKAFSGISAADFFSCFPLQGQKAFNVQA